MRYCVGQVCEALIRNEETLNDLDRGSGDGDTGSTMTAGATGENELGNNAISWKFQVLPPHCQ